MSTAAPKLRELLISEVIQAHNARAQRDRRAHFAAAYAYGHSLEILRESEDTGFADGVAVERIHKPQPADLAHAKEFLGDVTWKELGFKDPVEMTPGE